MEALKRLYFAFCKRWGPERLTVSAWAWKHQRTGLIRVIDAGAVLFKGEYHHCFNQHRREAAK